MRAAMSLREERPFDLVHIFPGCSVNREYLFTVFDQLAFHNGARCLDAEPVGTVIELEITDEMGLALHSLFGGGTLGGGYRPPPVTVQGGHLEERCQTQSSTAKP